MCSQQWSSEEEEHLRQQGLLGGLQQDDTPESAVSFRTSVLLNDWQPFF